MESWEYRVEHVPATGIGRFLGCGRTATTWELIAVLSRGENVTLIFKRAYSPPPGYMVTADDRIYETDSESAIFDMEEVANGSN